MAARAIMVQGTASHVGKSVIVAGLCRIFAQDGHRVTPFKSQNMALNSFVTRDGGEVGRAQAVQAIAAGLEPTVDMNPVLLKPTRDFESQVIVHGRPVGNMRAGEYHLKFLEEALKAIEGSLRRLQGEYELIVIEGAGSPAEVNLKEYDVVNMRIAHLAKAPVLLVADIDKGGVLASIVGTLELLDPCERDLVAGFIINKFRGDIKLLEPAIDFLEEKTKRKVLGVVPFIRDLGIQEEDSISHPSLGSEEAEIKMVVVRLPHISNFTDFDHLNRENGVVVKFSTSSRDLENVDAIILPGTKNTIEDMVWLWKSGLAEEILIQARKGRPILGICGGYQMLGERIMDSEGVESRLTEIGGLALLPVITKFSSEKVTFQVEAEFLRATPLFPGVEGERIRGYEIHMGRVELLSGRPIFKFRRGGEEIMEGATDGSGRVFGTQLHDLFGNSSVRRSFINALRRGKGLNPLGDDLVEDSFQDKALDEFANILRRNLDMKKIYGLVGL